MAVRTEAFAVEEYIGTDPMEANLSTAIKIPNVSTL